MLNKKSYSENDLKEIIDSIAIGVSSSSGDEFFEKLVLHLWKLYKMSYIMIGTINTNNTVTTLKFCINGKIVENITYDLEFSPCADVIKDKSAVYKKDVQKHFSNDTFFKENGIESYLGIRLIDSLSNGIGVISCLDEKELAYPATMHSILEIFASRASAEIERMRAEENLENSINERTKELTDALEHIQQQSKEQLMESEKMAALGAMVAGFTHDLNTPIGISVTASTYIRSESENMTRKVEEGNLSKSDLLGFLEDSHEMSESMFQNLQIARELIKSFKLISIDQHVKDERNIFLNAYIEDIIKSLNYKIKNKNIKIINYIEKDLELYVSGGILFQIFGNLIINSIKHGFDGINEGKIEIEASYINNILDVKYSDNGKGMNEDTKEKIFEQFFTTKKDDGGTGLGMFTMHELVVSRLGGKVDVTSALNEGVIFDIKIPFKK